MRQWRFGYFAGLVVALAGSGCGTSESTKSTQPTTDVGSGTDAAAVDGVAADAATAVTTLGTCNYVNPFSSGAECKAYTGAGWTAESAAADRLDGQAYRDDILRLLFVGGLVLRFRLARRLDKGNQIASNVSATTTTRGSRAPTRRRT